MYKRKTVDEFQIHGNFTGEWEEVTAESTRKEALVNLRLYRQENPGVPFKLVKKRVKQ